MRVDVAGTAVFVAGGGSVLTRIPLSGNGVSVGVRVGVPVADPEPHAVTNAASTIMIAVFLIGCLIQRLYPELMENSMRAGGAQRRQMW